MKTKILRHHSRPLRCLLACVGALLAAPAAHAQVNKCIDAAGKVVGYASQCPPGTRSEATNIRNSTATPAAPAARSIAEQEAEFRKRQTDKQKADAKAEKQASEQAERARACDNARSYLKTLQSGLRIARTDPRTGERVFLGDSERSREIESAQRAVELNCK